MVVVVVMGGGVVVVVMGGAGGGAVVTVAGAFAVGAAGAGAVLGLLLLGETLATVTFAPRGVVERSTFAGDGLVDCGAGVPTEPPPLPVAVPEPLTAGLEKLGFNGPGVPAFCAR